MDLGNFEALRASSTFERFSKVTQDHLNRMMSTLKEAMQEIGVVEATPESAGVVVEVPKSPKTPRPKKDKKTMIPVHVSPRNPQRNELTL